MHPACPRPGPKGSVGDHGHDRPEPRSSIAPGRTRRGTSMRPGDRQGHVSIAAVTVGILSALPACPSTIADTAESGPTTARSTAPTTTVDITAPEPPHRRLPSPNRRRLRSQRAPNAVQAAQGPSSPTARRSTARACSTPTEPHDHAIRTWHRTRRSMNSCASRSRSSATAAPRRHRAGHDRSVRGGNHLQRLYLETVRHRPPGSVIHISAPTSGAPRPPGRVRRSSAPTTSGVSTCSRTRRIRGQMIRCLGRMPGTAVIRPVPTTARPRD